MLHNKLKEKDVEFPVEIKRYFAGMELEDLWIKYPWDAEYIEEHTKLENQMLQAMEKEGKELYS